MENANLTVGYPPSRLGKQMKPFAQAFSGYEMLRSHFAPQPLRIRENDDG